MLPLVRLQLGLGEESLAAVAAEQLEVAGVSSHVRKQVPPVAELLLALQGEGEIVQKLAKFLIHLIPVSSLSSQCFNSFK